MSRRRRAAALLALPLLALAPGCGGDDGDDGPTLSASAYRAKANQICTTLRRDNEAALKDIDRDDRSAIVAATKKVGEQSQAALQEIRDLRGPDAAENATDRFLDAARELSERATKGGSAEDVSRFTQRIQAAARDAGLEACAS